MVGQPGAVQGRPEAVARSGEGSVDGCGPEPGVYADDEEPQPHARIEGEDVSRPRPAQWCPPAPGRPSWAFLPPSGEGRRRVTYSPYRSSTWTMG